MIWSARWLAFFTEKKNKRNKSINAAPAKAGKTPGKLRASDETKKFNPLARNILYTDLIILAMAQIAYSNGWIGDTVSGITTIMGIILLIMALYIQFGPKKDNSSKPRL